MAICRTIGTPDFFITFTCNQIGRKFLKCTKASGQRTEDRPDIIARIFRMKHKQLMKLFREKKVFWECISSHRSLLEIYEFELQKQYPSVERLQYHLPNEQFVVFNEDDHLYDVVNRNGVQDTMLTKWFEANKKYPVARTLTYVQFPTAWVWKRDKKQWEMRKKGKCIGRLPYAHPNSGEKYYLRMLLYKVCGAECHKDIRTFEGSVYPTFKQACSARGLLDDDNEWHEALSEASSWASPIKLRNMFCTMLMFSEITDSLAYGSDIGEYDG
ncbi:UNVERIFIED_CONTAM: hypothetical protein Sradi_0000100 [Sesamum radiatum]|uniref:Helitron helicase-like domain-containing protein n=1 Tax=Sesamum radiatum TaxID=300843 RepID=A0AAW2WJF4_SESRA